MCLDNNGSCSTRIDRGYIFNTSDEIASQIQNGFQKLFHRNGGIFQSCDVDGYESSMFNFPVEIETLCRLIGSANGLICVATYLYHWQFSYHFLWNPCTGECRRIPVPLPAERCNLFGFGYDSVSDDYKILGYWHSDIRVFSLKINTWKKLEYSVKSLLTLKNVSFSKGAVSALYTNGALLWCAGPQIAAFDLANEQFLFLDLPEEVKFGGFYIFSCVPLFNDYHGLLCLSWNKSIWMMKEYGNSKSWAKLTTSLSWEYGEVVGISKLGEVVFRTDVGLVKSDIQGNMCCNDKLKIIDVADAFAYKESLISPRCFDRHDIVIVV